jgi:hypothetical protein
MKALSMAAACILFVSALVQADPPPFGTVIEEWSLQMSGSYAGSGVTWRRDEGRFYLTDQGFGGTVGVWNLDPADPEGTIEAVPWRWTNLGSATQDIPWGFAWDNDSGCFWVSQIVDGDIYGGSYMLRHIWNGSRWVWAGTARDSWKLPENASCGAMEKHAVEGAFYGSLVKPLQDTSGLSRFDPYTKSAFGFLTNGVGVSDRGLTLVPGDSSYILTCGWNSATYRKRDSTGLLLQSVRASSGPADWALYVPSVIRDEDTVCTFCINSDASNTFQRVSVGMLWSQLGSALAPNVKPVEILSPFGVVDSGQTIYPRLVIRNTGQEIADSVSIHLMIDNEMDRVLYHDSTYVLNVPPLSDDTIAFTPWIPVGRDSMGCLTWCFWLGDSSHRDDTMRTRFLVRVRDIAITAVNNPVPWDTIDPGAVYPQVEVWNLGNLTMTFPMIFNIGPYFDTVQVVNLLAGGSRTVTASRPWNATPGIWLCDFFARVAGDLHPENNDTSFTIIVRETINNDVGIEILAPRGIVDTLPFSPLVRYTNYGAGSLTCTTYCWMEDSTDSIVYSDDSPVMLPAGGSTTVAYRPCTLKVEGQYTASCSVLDTVVHQVFWVVASAGVAEQPKFKLEGQVPEQTIVRGMLELPRDMTGQNGDCPSGGGPVPALLLDVAGRKVMDLKPGLNDIRHLAPGIHYLRLVVGDSVTSRKLVKLK